MKILISVIFSSIFSLVFSQKETVFSNIKPRLDKNGIAIDAHGGRIIKVDKTYYWYCETYGKTNGFTTANYYSCYSSSDMITWNFAGKLLPDAPKGVYYRPHVIYNAKSKFYILWYNWYEKLWDGKLGVAVSKTPEGPFKIVNSNVKLRYAQTLKVGDYNLFVNDDKSAYIVYNTIDQHKISIEKLSNDYLSSTQENSGFLADGCEASTMFKRNGLYYVLTDNCCCFCGDGSGARVYIAQNPLGPYRYTNNINRFPGQPVYNLFNNVLDLADALNIEKGYSILVNADNSIKCNQINITLGWKNYRTHCEANTDDSLKFKSDINPTLTLEYKKDKIWQQLPTKISIENKVIRLEYDYKFNEIEATEFRLKVDSSIYSPVHISEIEFFRNNKKISTSMFKAYKTDQNSNGQIIIPAQQSFVMELPTIEGVKYIWMGDLWGSRTENVKGQDLQYWSKPMEFNSDGTIKQLEWVDQWSTILVQ